MSPVAMGLSQEVISYLLLSLVKPLVSEAA